MIGVRVYYSKVIEGKSLIESAQEIFTKDFDSLDAVYQWILTTDEPIIDYNIDIYEVKKDDKGQVQATVRKV